MAAKAAKTRGAQIAPTYQLLEVVDQSGGLDLRHSPTLLESDRALVLRNYQLANPGELVVRPGYLRWSTTSLGSTRYQGGARVYLASTQFLLTAWGGNVYRPPDGGAQSSVIEYSTLSDTAQVYFPYDRTLVAVFDGVNRPRKSTGDTTWTRMGIDASTGISTLASLSSGSLSSAEFELSFSYKDRGTAHESNITTRVSTITLTSTGALEVQIPNSSDAQTDAIVVYMRNKTAGEAVLRSASSFTASTGASSTGRITSSAWSANAEAPTLRNPPLATLALAVPWKNRWWAIVDNRLHFTELFQAQSWPTLFYIDLPFERGDTITAVVPQGDTLILFGQAKVFLILGETSLDFTVKPSAGAQAGALGARAVHPIENGILHASAEGVFIFDGASDRYLSHDIEVGWRDLIQQTASTALSLIAITHHFPYKEIRIAVPRLYPRATAGEWVLDLNATRERNRPAWTDTDRTIGGYILWNGNEPTAGDRGRLFSWATTGGQLFEESTGTSANSSNMIAEYEGPHFSLGRHNGRVIEAFGEYQPNAGNFSVEAFVDGVSQGTVGLSIAAGLATIGTAVIGTATLAGSGRRQWYVPMPLGADGRTLWLTHRYTGQAAFRTFTYALGLVPESQIRTFSE